MLSDNALITVQILRSLIGSHENMEIKITVVWYHRVAATEFLRISYVSDKIRSTWFLFGPTPMLYTYFVQQILNTSVIGLSITDRICASTKFSEQCLQLQRGNPEVVCVTVQDRYESN